MWGCIDHIVQKNFTVFLNRHHAPGEVRSPNGEQREGKATRAGATTGLLQAALPNNARLPPKPPFLPKKSVRG